MMSTVTFQAYMIALALTQFRQLYCKLQLTLLKMCSGMIFSIGQLPIKILPSPYVSVR